jgi:hypothetical protein
MGFAAYSSGSQNLQGLTHENFYFGRLSAQRSTISRLQYRHEQRGTGTRYGIRQPVFNA